MQPLSLATSPACLWRSYTTRTTLSIGSYSFTCTNQWGGDVIIAKYNASGGVEWAKKYGTDDVGL